MTTDESSNDGGSGGEADQAAGGLVRTRAPRASAPTASAPKTSAPKSNAPKSEQTRTLILETALRLFRERGYDRTTMRAIADEAGVSVGNAYYYFSSKEHLIQGFYDRMQE